MVGNDRFATIMAGSDPAESVSYYANGQLKNKFHDKECHVVNIPNDDAQDDLESTPFHLPEEDLSSASLFTKSIRQLAVAGIIIIYI